MFKFWAVANTGFLATFTSGSLTIGIAVSGLTFLALTILDEWNEDANDADECGFERARTNGDLK